MLHRPGFKGGGFSWNHLPARNGRKLARRSQTARRAQEAGLSQSIASDIRKRTVMRGSLWKSSLVVALALVGCGKGVVPTVAPIAPPRPNSTRVNRQDVQPIPNKEHRTHKNQNSNSNSSSSGECTQWNQTVNTSNATTGAY